MITQIAIAFFSTAFLDFIWARYNIACAQKQPLVAGVLASMIFALGGFVVLTYVGNSWMLLPACLGGFTGTFLSIWTAKK